MNKLLPSVKSLITLAALLCFLFQASAASAQKVSLSVRNATVKAAIERLQKDYGYSFVIKTKDADVNKKITLDVKNEEIGAVVGKMFAGQNVVSSVEGKMIAIMSAPAKRDAAARASVNAVVKGVVKDSAGNPITGATVIVDGTTIGATTDLDGSFSVRIGARTDVRLIVSYLGLKTREVAVDDPARFYEVRLENDNMALDEVVVVGYGTQRRSLVTNAISQFKPTEENMRSVMSPSELLQGRIAGVSISTSSGNLGSAEKMSIRGSSSLSASNEPLYVIDGIPLSNNSASLYSFGENMSSLATLNLTDIESIEVLKDAASAAIYGSRATNGVVLITTKQGREGKSEVKVNYGFSITQFPNTGRREYVGSKQYVEVFNEGVDNYNRQNGFTVNSSGYVKPIRNPYGDMPDTDWLDLIPARAVALPRPVVFGRQRQDQILPFGQLQLPGGRHQDERHLEGQPQVEHQPRNVQMAEGGRQHQRQLPAQQPYPGSQSRIDDHRTRRAAASLRPSLQTQRRLLHGRNRRTAAAQCRADSLRGDLLYGQLPLHRFVLGRGADHQGPDGQGVVQQRLGLHL